MGFQTEPSDLTLVTCQGEPQSHSHFKCLYLLNGARYTDNLLLDTNRKSYIGFSNMPSDLILETFQGPSNFNDS
jgi:hypothetical protein